MTKECPCRLVSFRAQYKLMIENNVPKEAKYLMPGRCSAHHLAISRLVSLAEMIVCGAGRTGSMR